MLDHFVSDIITKWMCICDVTGYKQANNMKIYLRSSFIFLFLGCIFAADDKNEDNLKTARHISTEVLGQQLLPYGENTVTFEDNQNTLSTGHVKFVDDTFVTGLNSKHVNKKGNTPKFAGVNTNADSNSQKVTFLDDLNDEVLTTYDELHNVDADFETSESTSNFKIHQLPQRELMTHDYNSLKPENNDIQFKNYLTSDESQFKDIKHGIGDTNSEHISGKRVVFEEDNKNNAQDLFGKKKKYKQTTRVPLISSNILKDPNIDYYGNGLSNPGYLGHNNPYNIYGAYPQHSLSQINPTVHSIQNNIPGLYPAQHSTGHSYSVQPGLTGHVGTGYGYATGYQGYYGTNTPQKTLAERAVSAVTDALTSIALYDDKQCVPRLLCEMSSGSTANSPTLLKFTSALAPLLTILQTFNAASSSPLFLFGRAAVLGISSKGHPAACRYAYPQCPTDPDKLTNYLNNHNGGFFRFFGHPKKQKEQQNLDQFYNQQSYQYDLQQQHLQQQAQQRPHDTQGLYRPYYEQKSQNVNDLDMDTAQSNIEERIQNKPIINNLEDEIYEEGPKWIFPDEIQNEKKQNESYDYTINNENKRIPKRIKIGNERGGNTLRFPDEFRPTEDVNDIDEERDIIRKQRITFYPNRNHFYTKPNYQSTTPVNLEDYIFDYKHNFYVKIPKNIAYNRNNDESHILYVVRGNGDPNHPEIVKVKPGQSA